MLSKKEDLKNKKNSYFSVVTPNDWPSPTILALQETHSLSASLQGIRTQMHQNLKDEFARTLTLNPSRREAIQQYLNFLSEQNKTLQDWIEIAKNAETPPGLFIYFDELISFYYFQAFLIKHWSELGICTFQEIDLSKLNWILHSVLKEKLPHHLTISWHFTRPNLYSWYQPNKTIQKQLYQLLQSCMLKEQALNNIKEWIVQHSHPLDYHYFFYKRWLEYFASKISSEQKKVLYCPTLSVGNLLYAVRKIFQLVGHEAKEYYFFLNEFLWIWEGPKPPPLWSPGLGLEPPKKTQLALNTGVSAIDAKIIELGACDAAFVMETSSVCSKDFSYKLKKTTENSFLKKIRTSKTGLGTLQACISLMKLRPHRYCLWGRTEAINIDQGQEALGFLLEQATFLHEFDLSKLEFSSTAIQLPKFLYIFQKEIDIEKKFTNRPQRHIFSGKIDHLKDVECLLENIFHILDQQSTLHSSFPCLSHTSCQSQKEWIEKWPHVATAKQLQKFEQLSYGSMPLNHFATVCSTPSTQQAHPYSFWLPQVHHEFKIFFRQPLHEKKSGFLVLTTQPDWAAYLKLYLEMPCMQEWLATMADKKSQKYLLTKQFIQMIPITRVIAKGLCGKPDKVIMRFFLLAKKIYQLEQQKIPLENFSCVDKKVNWKHLLSILPQTDTCPFHLHPGIKLVGTTPFHTPIIKIQIAHQPTHTIVLHTETGFQVRIQFLLPILQEILYSQIHSLQHPTFYELTQIIKLPLKPETTYKIALDIMHLYHFKLKEIQDHQKEAFNLKLF